MTGRDRIIEIIRETYAARVKGDLNGVMANFAEDAVFGLNGRGTGIEAMSNACQGCQAIETGIREFINAFRFENWKEHSILVDGENAVLLWSGDVTFVPNGRSDHFYVCDTFRFRDGKITKLWQYTDTALVASMVSAS